MGELQKQLEQRQQQQIQQQQQQQQQQNHNNQGQQPHRHLYQHQASTGQIPNFPNSQNQRLNDESPPLQQLRHESPVMNRAPIGTSGGSAGGGGGSSSLMAGLRGFTNDLVQQTSIAGGGGLPNHMNSASNSTAGGPPGLRKQPPPGFDPLSMLNSGSSNGQHSSQRNLLSPDMGLLNLETLTSQLNMNAGFGAGGGHHSNDLGGQTSGGQSRHDSGQTGPGNGFGSHSGLLSNHHLHNGLGGPQNPGLGSLGLKSENSSGPGGMPGQHNRPQPFLLEKQQQQRMYSQQSMMNHEHHHSQHERQMQRHQQQQQQQHQHQQHQHQQSRSGWNSVKSPHTNDW